jgi:hypothetical protein
VGAARLRGEPEGLGRLRERAARAGFLVVAPTLPTADQFGGTVQNLGNNTRSLGHVAEVFDPAQADGRGAPGDDGRRLGASGLVASYVAA